MINNTTDAHKEIISAINQVQVQKRAYEQNHIGEQNGPWKVIRGTLRSVPEIHTDPRLHTENRPGYRALMLRVGDSSLLDFWIKHTFCIFCNDSLANLIDRTW